MPPLSTGRYLSGQSGSLPNISNAVLLDNSADVSAPSAGKIRFYFKNDKPYYINSSSAVAQLIYGDSAGVIASLSATTAVFNDSGSSSGDVRIEGDTVDNLFLSDASADQVIIGDSTGITRLTVKQESAATNSVTDVLSIVSNSSGTPASGLGVGLSAYSETSTTPNTVMGRIRYHWTTTTHASRTARGTLSAYDTAERDCIKWEASGSAPMIGVFGTDPIVKPTVTGSRGGNAALASLCTALANLGWITNSTS